MPEADIALLDNPSYLPAVLGIAGAAFLWLVIQMSMRRRTGWLAAVVVPTVLAAFTLASWWPTIGYCWSGGTLMRVALGCCLGAAAIAGMLFDRNSRAASDGAMVVARRTIWPLVVWGIGMFLPFLETFGGFAHDSGKLSTAFALVGAVALLGQSLSWTGRLLAGTVHHGGTKGSAGRVRQGRRYAVAGFLATAGAIVTAMLTLPGSGDRPRAAISGAEPFPGTIMAICEKVGDRMQLFLVNRKTGESKRLAEGSYPEWSPDRRVLAFSGDGGRLWLAASEGSISEPLVEMSGNISAPTWAPDNRKIYFIWGTSFLQGSLWEVTVADGATRELLPKSEAPVCLAASPDGRMLAYVKGTDFASGLATATELKLFDLASGTNTTTLLEFPQHWDGLIGDIIWTADGSSIIVGISERTYDKIEYRSQLERVDIADGRRHRLGEPLDLRAESFTYDPEGRLMVVCWQPTNEEALVNKMWSIELASGRRTAVDPSGHNPFWVGWFSFPLTAGGREIVHGNDPPERTAANSPSGSPPERESPRRPGVDQAEASNREGDELARQQNWAAAENKYRQASQLDPTKAQYQCSLGVSLARQGKWQEAEGALREALRREPGNAAFHGTLGHVLRGQGRIREAEAALREAIRQDPSMAVLHNDLGAFLQEQQRWGEAEQYYRTAIRLAPENGQAHANLAGILYLTGRLDESARTAREAIRLGNKGHWVYDKLGF